MAASSAVSVASGRLDSASSNEGTPGSPKRLARLAGVLYLLVGIFGGFAEGYVEPKMYVAGNAAATAGNVAANAGLVRLGVVADLLDQTFFLFLALTLYLLLKHVNKSVARRHGHHRRARGRHHLPQHGLRVRGLAGRHRRGRHFGARVRMR